MVSLFQRTGKLCFTLIPSQEKCLLMTLMRVPDQSVTNVYFMTMRMPLKEKPLG